jgi:hypothetical protein
MAFLHAAEQRRTFCNPLPIPNHPVGVFARGVTHGTPDPGTGRLLGYREQYRELADPVVLWHEGKWYLYPSVDMAWVSADKGATWQHHPLNVRDVGYAPTVVYHRGRFLLAAKNEGDQRLLDRTMVLYGSNLGDANIHDNTNLPILLAGGGLQHGQHLAFKRDNNKPLSNLFVTMLQNMGIETDTFGSNAGTLNELKA